MGLFDFLFGSDEGSQKAAEAMRENLAYVKEQAAKDQVARDQILAGLQPTLDYANETDRKLIESAMADAATSRERGNTLWDQYMTSVVPVQKKFYQEALDYGGTADQERAAGLATSDVRQQYAIQKQANDRALAAMGVNPNSGRFASADRASELAAMAAAAGGATKARTTARDTGIQLRKDASTIGNATLAGSQDYTRLGLAGTQTAGGMTSNAVNRGLNVGQFKVGGTANAMNAVSNAAGNYANTLSQQDTSGLFPTIAGVGTAYALNRAFK